MEFTENYAWYRTGLVSVLRGSRNVTGTNTKWLTDGIKKGDALIIRDRFYEIDDVTGNETLSLVSEYTGENAASLEYMIIPRARAVLLAELALQIKQAVTYWNNRDKLYDEKLRQLEEKISDSSGTGTDTSTGTDSISKFFGSLGLYIDEDGDLSQDDEHVTTLPSYDYEEELGDIASDDDVEEMLDDVFSGD